MALKDMLTDNQDVLCIVRTAAAAVVTTGLGLAVYDVVVQHAKFDIQAYGIGSAAILASVGAALKLKPDSPVQ